MSAERMAKQRGTVTCRQLMDELARVKTYVANLEIMVLAVVAGYQKAGMEPDGLDASIIKDDFRDEIERSLKMTVT